MHYPELGQNLVHSANCHRNPELLDSIIVKTQMEAQHAPRLAGGTAAMDEPGGGIRLHHQLYIAIAIITEDTTRNPGWD
ncbi:hypothetical protein [Sphingomonas sp. DT-204]|uniref:hypothetical protein n=1 Tax=Sphingomonas sp. DT-204 TaxID=3396166 RepID=UPI003F1DCD77